jgi:peptidoglycan/xylan/chitin deacetylase (PgdA/CDA1 family)
MNFIFNILDNKLLYKVALSFQKNYHRVLYYHLLGKPRKKYEYYYYQSPPQTSLLLEQLNWLKSMGFNPVSIYDFLDDPKRYANQKTFSISTDDGYADTYETLVPIIAEKRIPCIFYLCNDAIDNNEFLWKDRIFFIINKSSIVNISQISQELEASFNLKELAHFKSFMEWVGTWPMEKVQEISRALWALLGFQDERIILDEIRPYFSSNQIQSLLSQGFYIGSHTFSHPDLKRLHRNLIFHEVVNSISDLRKRFNTQVDFFSYPYGSRVYFELEKDLVEKSGAKIFFGNTNYNNFSISSSYWGRDPMEIKLNRSKIWFSMLPILRGSILNPFKTGN